MADEFNAGDVVELKSGGPKMTIEDIGEFSWGSGRKQAKCAWFEGTERNEAVFELTSLKKAEPGPAWTIA